MEKSMCKYKAVIELDDEKLHADHYSVEDAYRIVKKMFADKGIKDISEGRHLVFVTDTGKGWSGISANFVTLWLGWARPYLKVVKFYDMKKGIMEDIITSFENVRKRRR